MRKSFYNSEEYWKNYYPSDNDYYLCKAWRNRSLTERQQHETGLLSFEEELSLKEEFETEYRMSDRRSEDELKESIYKMNKIHHKLMKSIEAEKRVSEIDMSARSFEEYDKAVRTGRSLAYCLSYGLGIGLFSFVLFALSEEHSFLNAILMFWLANMGFFLPGALIGAFVHEVVLPRRESLRNYTPLVQILFSVLLAIVTFVVALGVCRISF